MKSVLMSIQPYWVFLIIAEKLGWNIGKKKTIEVRKNRPKDENWNNVTKIYCSKDKKSFARIPKEYQPLMERFLGKVIGEFVCDEITEYEGEFWDDETYENIKEIIHTTDWYGYPEIEYNRIAENGEENNLCKSSYLTWEELRNYMGAGINTFFGWHISDLVIYDKPKGLSKFYKCGFYTMEELDEELCNYCSETNYGTQKGYGTPNGYVSCEGRFCNNAYREYLEDNFSITRPPQSWCYVEGSE